MKIIINAADLICIPLAIYLAIVISPWWWPVAPLIVTGWFIKPRWNRADGWRFKP